MHWAARGAYLHLEASELIEAIRGKRGDPRAEAADVLIVLMSITESRGISWESVLATAQQTVQRLEKAPRYPFESRLPELGAIHADGGHPEHVPQSVYEDGRA